MKRVSLFAAAVLPWAVLFSFAAAAEDASPTIVVYKSPTCGCCAKWEKHLEANGFKVEEHPTSDMVSVKDKYHVPKSDRSCHTALVGKYVVEGHVPADDIKKLLKENPAGVTGIAVPQMPIGSPGMESSDPSKNEHYDVVTFDADGKTKVYDHK